MIVPERKMDLPHLVLASKSPRRQELLALCGLSFEICSAEIEEETLLATIVAREEKRPFSEICESIVTELAYEKARFAKNAMQKDGNIVVIGSDTIVVVDDQILGKPSSPEHALEMLTLLAGRTHFVYTGVCLLSEQKQRTFSRCTKVQFRKFDEDYRRMALQYIQTGSPLDKAGAYGIQDQGAIFIEQICGDYYNVMGLPIADVYFHLKEFGLCGDLSVSISPPQNHTEREA